MRPEERIDNFLRILGEEWKRQGVDLRFTQFLINNGIEDLGILYNFEENEFIETAFPHIPPREYMFWGTRGISGDQPLTYIVVKDLETDHIQAILANIKVMWPEIRACLENELKLRLET